MRELFDEVREKSTLTWNAMAVAYNRHGDFESADRILPQMPEKNVACWNNVITGHEFGDVAAAKKAFDTMPERDSVSMEFDVCWLYSHQELQKCCH